LTNITLRRVTGQSVPVYTFLKSLQNQFWVRYGTCKQTMITSFGHRSSSSKTTLMQSDRSTQEGQLCSSCVSLSATVFPILIFVQCKTRKAFFPSNARDRNLLGSVDLFSAFVCPYDGMPCGWLSIYP